MPGGSDREGPGSDLGLLVREGFSEEVSWEAGCLRAECTGQRNSQCIGPHELAVRATERPGKEWHEMGGRSPNTSGLVCHGKEFGCRQ